MIPVGLEGVGMLESVELFVSPCQLSSPVRTARHVHAQRRLGFIRVRCSGAEGFGELAAMDQRVGRDPLLDEVLGSLATRWIPRLFEAASARGGACPPSHALSVLGGSTAIDRMASAALEMAILDAELRAADLSLARWLHVEGPSVAYGALCGMPEDRSVGAFVEGAQALLDGGASRLRLKIDPSWATEPIQALRRVAPSALLQADANGSLRGPLGRSILREIDHLGLTCIEEPLGSSDLTANAALSAELRTPLCLDETVTTPRGVRDALRYHACRVLCIKPARLGGIRAALRALEDASAAGVDCFIGGMFEAGLARSSLAVLSGRPEATLIGDVAAAGSYLDVDPCGQSGPVGNRQPLFAGPGVGPWPELALLESRWEVHHPGP